MLFPLTYNCEIIMFRSVSFEIECEDFEDPEKESHKITIQKKKTLCVKDI